MNYDFDTVIPRRGSGSIKFDRKPELDPFWVADMDFASAPEIIEALQQRINHGVFGYSQAHEGLNRAIHQYLRNRRDAAVSQEHLVHLGGLVPALSLAARAFCEPGDAVMTCTPVYPPFTSVHSDAGAQLITVDHIYEDDQWTFDWKKMEASVTAKTRVFILCNPQNPLGRVFKRSELEQLGAFCLKHELVLISDEIHCDLIFDEVATPHISALNLNEDIQKITVTLLSPSKTWNIAGLGYAFAVISNDRLRRKFNAARGHTLAEINALSYYAAEAAYLHGEPWRQQMLNYLIENRKAMTTFISERLPNLTLTKAEATYLAWIDASGSGLEKPATALEERGKLFVSDGAFFGWPQWFRFNFACPRSRMVEGLEKIARAIESPRSAAVPEPSISGQAQS